MEHMKKFLMILVAVVAAGAAFMYARKFMMERKGESVKIQSMADQQTQRYSRPGAPTPG